MDYVPCALVTVKDACEDEVEFMLKSSMGNYHYVEEVWGKMDGFNWLCIEYDDTGCEAHGWWKYGTTDRNEELSEYKWIDSECWKWVAWSVLCHEDYLSGCPGEWLQLPTHGPPVYPTVQTEFGYLPCTWTGVPDFVCNPDFYHSCDLPASCFVAFSQSFKFKCGKDPHNA